MSLTGSDNYFEDFEPGQAMRHARGKTMCEQDNVGITLMVLNTADEPAVVGGVAVGAHGFAVVEG